MAETHVHVVPIRPEHADDPLRTWDELCNVGVLSPAVDEPAFWMNVECDGEECERIPEEMN